MEGTPHPIPRTVEEVFNDFKGRRAGLLKALTTESERFYQHCDPECAGLLCLSAHFFRSEVIGSSPQFMLVEKDNLCLYGLPNETWEVNLPVEEVPPELPEPVLGINFARDGMKVKDWLSLVAVHSDSWLLSVSFYFGARFGFGKTERKRLFQMVNELPTLFEIVNGPVKQEQAAAQNNSSKNKSSGRMPSRHPDSQPKEVKMSAPKDEEESGEEEEEQEDEHGDTICGACGDSYADDEFWICCDICEKWFHGKCVKITPAKAEHIKQYKCPICSNKRARV
ncbi:hypothetical protein DH2020_044983 [Rehmannia glutinosa]|uniref:PHD finger protein ALFIN-LIKE n=1 Tax=Rehmannia glutinosa TaxID=99300 RepID=A0ABR0UFE9_REHGL